MGRNEELVYTLAGMIGAIVSLAMFPFAFRQSGDAFSISSVVAVTSAALSAYLGIYVHRQRQRVLRRRRVFVIYSHGDIDAATTLVAQLKQAGFAPWFDQDDIAAGQHIEQALMAGLADSAVAIVLISKHAAAPSEWLAREIELALSALQSRSTLYSPVIPVRLDDTAIPPQLKGVSGIRLQNEDDFDRLAKGLRLAMDT